MVSFKKEHSVKKDNAIIKAFQEGKTDEQIAKIVSDLNLPFLCPDCHKYHSYTMTASAVLFQLARLKLIPYETATKILEQRKKDYQAWRQAIRKDAVKKMVKKSCVFCGTNDRLEVHHIIPVCQGGTNAEDNLQVLCYDCHKKLHWPVRQKWFF